MPVALSVPKVDQYELARKRAEQRANAAQQASADAMKRRFAALGSLNSGAAIKAQQNAANEINTQKEQTMQGIEAAQAQEMQRRQEIQDQMRFQSQEAEKGRVFGAGEAEKQRGFEGSQNKLSRDLQKYGYDLADKRAVQQLEQQAEQFKQQHELNQSLAQQEEQAMLFNMATAAMQNGNYDEYMAILDKIQMNYGRQNPNSKYGEQYRQSLNEKPVAPRQPDQWRRRPGWQA